MGEPLKEGKPNDEKATKTLSGTVDKIIPPIIPGNRRRRKSRWTERRFCIKSFAWTIRWKSEAGKKALKLRLRSERIRKLPSHTNQASQTKSKTHLM